VTGDGLEGMHDDPLCSRANHVRNGVRLRAVVERCGRGVGADQVDVRRLQLGVAQRGARSTRQTCSRAIRRGDVHGVATHAEAQ
jgi:hypothetical protein